MRVALCDIGPGDGLQNEPEILGPTVRAELGRARKIATDEAYLRAVDSYGTDMQRKRRVATYLEEWRALLPWWKRVLS